MWLVIIAVINTVVSAFYYFRVVRVMYLNPPASPEAVPSSTPLRAALAITALAVLAIGILPAPLLHISQVAAAALGP